MRALWRAVVVGLIAVPFAGWGQNASLLVLSKEDHTLAIVDPVSLKVIAKAPVGEDPHEVVASSDGKTAYVSDYGGGTLRMLSVVDLENHTALPAIDLGVLKGPHGLTFVGGKLWFTVEGSKAIARFDPATQKIDWVLGTGQNRTHMIYVNADQTKILTTNVASGTVSVIDMEAVKMGPPPGPGQGHGAMPGPPGMQMGHGPVRLDWNETVVPVGNGSEGFDLSPDGKEMWVGNAQDGTISVIDLAAKKVVATLDAKVNSVNRLRFTPDGKSVIVSLLGGADLVVLDAATRRVVKRVPIGRGAAGIEMDPDGTKAFVSCTPDGYVAVIDLKTMTVVGHINAGGGPDGLAWAVRR